MNITTHDIQLKQGDDTQLRIRLTHKNGEPFVFPQVERVDLHACINKKVVLRLSSEEGSILFLNEEKSELVLDIRHDMTAEANWETADYDLQFIYTQGNRAKRQTVLQGIIELIPDYTHI